MLVGLVGPARIPCHGATLVVPIVQLNAFFLKNGFPTSLSHLECAQSYLRLGVRRQEVY